MSPEHKESMSYVNVLHNEIKRSTFELAVTEDGRGLQILPRSTHIAKESKHAAKPLQVLPTNSEKGQCSPDASEDEATGTTEDEGAYTTVEHNENSIYVEMNEKKCKCKVYEDIPNGIDGMF